MFRVISFIIILLHLYKSITMILLLFFFLKKFYSIGWLTLSSFVDKTLLISIIALYNFCLSFTICTRPLSMLYSNYDMG